MARCAALVMLLGLFPAVPGARADDAKVAHETTLLASPAGAGTLSLGDLAADAPVTVMERQGSWVRVRVEGWLPADAIATRTASAPAPAAPVVAAPVVAAPAAIATATAPSGSARLEGTLEIRKAGWMRKKKVTGAGRSVWLLPSGFDLQAAEPITAEEQTQVDQLDADAARLTREADKAMHGSNFTESTRRHDELIKQRDQLLSKRTAILGLNHGRREAVARQAALATAVCDARGFYAFPSIAPGAYRLYARLVDRELDLEWIEAVDVGAAGSRLDLDETRAQGMPRGSS